MDDKKRRILEMVKEGLLTADEALVLLEQLEKNENSDVNESAAQSKELSTVVSSGTHEEGGSSSKRQSSPMDKIIGIVDGIVQKIKDADLDFNFGPSVDIDHIFHEDGVAIKEVEIDVANGEMILMPGPRTNVEIECSAKVYGVDSMAAAREKLLKETTYSNVNGKLRFILQDRSVKMKAIVRIPDAHYEELKVRMFNGAITGEKIHVDNLRIKTGNGKVEFTDFHAKDAEFETVNGAVTLKKFELGKLEVETMNGAIDVEGAFRKGDLQTINGNIRCLQAGHYGETIRAKASSGSVQLLIPSNTSCDGELKSNLGSFHLDLSGIQVIEEKNEVVQKLLRFQSKKELEHSVHILAESKASSITIKHI